MMKYISINYSVKMDSEIWGIVSQPVGFALKNKMNEKLILQPVT
jgi:hypothetical protein